MRYYLIRRLLLIFPTLLVVSIVVFLLSKIVPQDPVLSQLRFSATDIWDGREVNSEALYSSTYLEMGLDLPNFYFSVLPDNYPSNLNAISNWQDKKLIKALITQGYNFDQIDPLIHCLSRLRIGEENAELIQTFYNSAIINQLSVISDLELQQVVAELDENKSTYFVPSIRWHGLDNQYHQWLSSTLQGQFGRSFISGKTALSQVSTAMLWTLAITLPAILITYTLGLIVGYVLGRNPKGKKERVLNHFFYLIYSIPMFWLASLLVVYFTTNDHGAWTNIFPSVGIDIYPGSSTTSQIWMNYHRLLLPIICISIVYVAYIARLFRRSILDERQATYVMTAYAKGLSDDEVLRKHIVPNAMLPLITLMVGSFPRALGGSVVIELIFNVPGVGRLLYDSLGLADWNIVFCIVMTISLVTIIAYLLGDFLYALVDPRIRYE